MFGATKITVFVPWGDVRDALDLLGRAAGGHFKARPVGNRVVIDFAEECDAQLVVETFAHSRVVKVDQ